MLNPRQLGILASLALAMMILALLATQRHALEERGEGVGERLLPTLSEVLPKIDEVELSSGGERATLVRNAEEWSVKERGGFGAERAKIHALLLSLAQLEKVEPKTSNPELYAALELDEKQATKVVLKSAAKPVAMLWVGKKGYALDDMSQSVFVRVGDEQTCWLARGNLTLPKGAAEWLETLLLDIPHEKVMQVRIHPTKGEEIIAKGQNGALELQGIPAGREVDGFALESLGRTLFLLHFEDVRPLRQGVAIEREVTFALDDGTQLLMRLYTQEGKTWAQFAPVPAEAFAELQKKTAGWEFALPSYKTEALFKPFEAFLKPLAQEQP